MKQSALFTALAQSTEQFAEQLDSVTTAVLDCHCPRKKWSIIRDVLHSKQAPAILMPIDSKLLCDTIADIFINKIQNISANILSLISTLGKDSDVLYADPKHTGDFFSFLRPPSFDEVLKLIKSTSGKSSLVDNIPTLSFRDGVFPTAYKSAHMIHC